MPLVSVEPATGKEIARYDAHPDGEVARRLAASVDAFHGWRRVPLAERAAVLMATADLLRDRKRRYAELMAREMGKAVVEGVAEVEKCAWVCEHYAEHGADLLAPRDVETGKAPTRVRHDPLGPVLAIMPWNFPFWQVFRAAAPTLMAGNTVLLKHASNVTGCALAIEDLLREAGLPEGAFQALLVPSDRVAGVIRDPRVRGVTLTGSEAAGRAVAAEAGNVVKPVVLELGGSDPFIVLDDADVDAAAATAAKARCINAGQSCIAAKRFVVHEAVHDDFLAGLVEHMAALRVGDPLDEATVVGPQAREDLRNDLQRQVDASVAAGAHVLLGGAIPDGPGFYYPPTVLDAVPVDAPALNEEVFGPVAAVVAVPDDAAALALANGSRYGLGASVWTRDRVRAERFVARLEAGSVFVNALVRSDPRLPFGGVKASGYGRELGREGVTAFTNVKTVWMEGT